MRYKKSNTSVKRIPKGQYKSGLEKAMAKALTENNIKFDYEKREYTVLDGFHYHSTYLAMTAGKQGLTDKSNKKVLPIKYTPDFTSTKTINDIPIWFVETKGYVRDGGSFPLRWKMFLKKMTDNGFQPAVFIPKNQGQLKQVVEQIIKIEKEYE